MGTKYGDVPRSATLERVVPWGTSPFSLAAGKRMAYKGGGVRDPIRTSGGRRMYRKNRIAILTGGGDAPGINAVIRAVAKKAILECGMEVIGVEDGYEGLIRNRHRTLHYDDVSGVLTVGGTILGASKISNPYRYAARAGGRVVFKDVSRRAIRNARALGIDALVRIGGARTLGIAHRLMKDGVAVVGIPKTIDNDIRGTEVTFGFGLRVATPAEAIDRLHPTRQSHHRAMIIEVLGHRAGWAA